MGCMLEHAIHITWSAESTRAETTDAGVSAPSSSSTATHTGSPPRCPFASVITTRTRASQLSVARLRRSRVY